MNLIIRLRYNQVPSVDPGNMVGVFVGNSLRGVGTAVNIGGQQYFFVTVYSNQYTGETLRFRAYYAPDDRVYSTIESVTFTHHAIASTPFQPFWIDINPNTDFAPEILPIPADTTLQTIPFDPVNLNDYLLSLDGDPVTWSAVPGPNLSASIVNGILTVTPLSAAWTGTSTVMITATENTPNHYIFTRTAFFTVLPDYGPPVFQPIPNQTIFPGETFTPFDLDQYLTFNGPCRAFGFETFPYTGNAPDPAWPAVPPTPASMNVVVRPLFADKALAGPGAKLAAFVNNVLVGTATPNGVPPNVHYPMSLQNLAAGPISFRFYHAENQYLYEKTTTLLYKPNTSAGSVAAPYLLQLSPVLPALSADGTVQVTVVDPSWLGAYPINFYVWDCNFPLVRRDTVQVLFSVVEDKRPKITSPPTVGFQENACSVLYNAEATDPHDSEGNGLTYSISGGADAQKFAIDPLTGQLSWYNFSPDFENPADDNTDNQYELSIRVTNSLNLSDELMLIVSVTNQVAEPFQPQINGGVTSVCMVGNSMQLLASGGISYLWNDGSTAAGITVIAEGAYTVTVTGDGACSAVLTVAVSKQPTISAAGNASPVCINSGISLTSTPAGGAVPYATFVWEGPNGFTATEEDPAAFAATPAAAGVYTVTVTDNAGCSATATTTIAVAGNSAPAILAFNSGPVCAGAGITLTSSPSGGASPYIQFKWAGPNGYLAGGQNPAAFQTVSGSAGTYTVTVTDNAGCTATATTTVQVNSRPSVAVSSNSPVCADADLLLNAMPGGGSGAGYSFLWAGPGNYNANVSAPAAIVATQGAAGAYTVTVTDGAGCTATGTTVVAVFARPSIAIQSPAPVCQGGALTLISTPSGGSGIYPAFLWAGPNGFMAAVEDPAAFPATPAAAGTYTVMVTDNAGCTASATTTVAVNPPPVISAANNGPLCQGASLTLSAMAGGGTGNLMFNWTGPDFYAASVEDPAPFSTTAASAGIYQVKVTDSKGCTATATTSVAVSPEPTITASSNSPVCTGGNINLYSNPAGGSGVYASFVWSGPNNYMAMQEDPAGFAAGAVYIGTYRVTVTDNIGCTATASTSVSVSSNAAPNISASGNGPLCAGQNIQLNANPGGAFTQIKWSGPNTYTSMQEDPPAFPATGAASGVYTVTVTDTKGCIGTSSVTVVVNAPVAHPGTNSPICQGTTVYLSAMPSGSTAGYNAFNWSGPNGYSAFGEFPAGFQATQAAEGTYTVTVTDNMGCTGTGTVAVSFENNDPPTITCPADQTVAADAGCTGVLGAWTGFATNVNDDCTAQNNIAVTQMPDAGTALSGHNTEQIVTLTADDGTGNTTPCTFKVVLQDKTPPTITCPADQTVLADAGCSGTVGDRINLAVNVGDNCTTAPEVTQFPVAGTPLSGHNDEETVTLTADDGNGNTTPCTFKVILKDITPPTITCPADQTVMADGACSGTVGNRTGLAMQVADNCTTSPAVSQMPAANTVLSGHNDEETVTLTADDGNGNTTPCTFRVILKDITPPTITCPADQTVMADGACSGTVGNRTGLAMQVTDNCTTSPAVSQMPAANTVLSGHNDEELVTLTADDGNGNTTPCTFKVILKDITPPTITCPADQTVMADGACSGTVGNRIGLAMQVTDNCTASPAVSQMPAANTVLSGHNDEETVTLTADDGNGNTTPCTFKVILKDITPPTITCPADQTVMADGACSGTVGNRIGLAMQVTDNCTASPAVSQMPAANTVLSGHNDAETVTLTADDGNGNTTPCTFKVILKDVTPPVISCPNHTTVSCAGNVPLPNANLVSATDNCGPIVKSHLFDTPPYDVTCLNRFKITRTYRVNDGAGNSTTCTQRITVFDNTQPTFTSVPLNVIVQCNAVPAVGTPVATDNCNGGVTIVYNGQTVSNITCTDTYILTRQWTATDVCGNTKTATQRITVRDTQKPVFTKVPANVTVQCDAVPVVGTTVATDNCDTQVTITYNGETRTDGACPDTYILTRRWTAADNCSNTQTATQRITVRDTQKPVFTVVPAPITIECSDVLPPVGTAIATDNCDASVTVTYLGQSGVYVVCPNNNETQRIWLATDNCGNSTTAVQIITMQDTQAPVFTSVPDDVTIQCSDLVPPIGTPTATDACIGYVQITFLGQTSVGGSCPYNYTITRRWRAQDECGNSVTASHTITVEDTQAPTFTNAPANVTVNCSNIPSVPVVLAQDNCSPATVSYLGQTQGPGDCASGYALSRTWTTTDQCGNTRTHTQVIFVSDQIVGGPTGPAGIQSGGADDARTVTRETNPDAGKQNAVSGRQPGALRLMPNPATEEVWAAFEAETEEEATLLLFDADGRLVMRQEFITLPGANRYRVDLAGLPGGVYSVQIIAGRQIQSGKLVVWRK